MGDLFSIIIMLLILLFFISFALFTRRLLINASVKSNRSNELENKINRLIEQNEQLLLLLKNEK